MRDRLHRGGEVEVPHERGSLQHEGRRLLERAPLPELEEGLEPRARGRPVEREVQAGDGIDVQQVGVLRLVERVRRPGVLRGIGPQASPRHRQRGGTAVVVGVGLPLGAGRGQALDVGVEPVEAGLRPRGREGAALANPRHPAVRGAGLERVVPQEGRATPAEEGGGPGDDQRVGVGGGVVRGQPDPVRGVGAPRAVERAGHGTDRLTLRVEAGEPLNGQGHVERQRLADAEARGDVDGPVPLQVGAARAGDEVALLPDPRTDGRRLQQLERAESRGFLEAVHARGEEVVRSVRSGPAGARVGLGLGVELVEPAPLALVPHHLDRGGLDRDRRAAAGHGQGGVVRAPGHPEDVPATRVDPGASTDLEPVGLEGLDVVGLVVVQVEQQRLVGGGPGRHRLVDGGPVVVHLDDDVLRTKADPGDRSVVVLEAHVGADRHPPRHRLPGHVVVQEPAAVHVPVVAELEAVGDHGLDVVGLAGRGVERVALLHGRRAVIDGIDALRDHDHVRGGEAQARHRPVVDPVAGVAAGTGLARGGLERDPVVGDAGLVHTGVAADGEAVGVQRQDVAQGRRRRAGHLLRGAHRGGADDRPHSGRVALDDDDVRPEAETRDGARGAAVAAVGTGDQAGARGSPGEGGQDGQQKGDDPFRHRHLPVLHRSARPADGNRTGEQWCKNRSRVSRSRSSPHRASAQRLTA